MKRKITALILACSIIFGTAMGLVSAEDNYANRGQVCDMLITAADDYNPGIVKADILKGYEDGELHEERNVTRVEALVMLKRAFGDIPEIKGSNKYLAIPQENFTDIPDWAQEELSDVFAAGIVAGKAEGIFAPDDNVTVNQMELFIKRMYRVFGTNEKDDFYAAVNKDFLDNTVISSDMYRISALDGQLTRNQLMDMMAEISASNPDKNSKEGKIKTLYDNYLNKEARNELGFGAIKPYFDEIDAVHSVSDLVESGLIDTFLDFSVGIDTKDTTKYVSTFETLSINPFDIFAGKESQAEYIKFLKELFTLAGYTEDEAETAANDAWNVRGTVAGWSLSGSDAAHANNIFDEYLNSKYNEFTLDEIIAEFPTVDIEKVFGNTGLKNKDRFIVRDRSAMKVVSTFLDDENIDMLKNYLKADMLQSYAEYLSDDFVELSGALNAEKSGIEGTPGDEYYATHFVNEYLVSYVGEIYGNKYTDEKIKSDVTGMVNDMMDIYREKITNLDWMSDTTKEKALKKLDAMTVKVGTADSWNKIALDDIELRSYEDGGNLVENLKTIEEANKADLYALEGAEFDHTEWIIAPHTENACYLPQFNDCYFPIAILLVPEVYSPDASYEENLGAIGYVIGHELSHAFDIQGSKYDEYGYAVDWWTDEDSLSYAAVTQKVLEYYSGQEMAPGLVTNGMNTLAENIADMGGLSIVLELASRKENFDYKAMFESFAKVYREVLTREAAEYLLYDDHAPSNVRANRTLQSCDKFYEVYRITEGDGMWIDPEDRVSIW